MSSKKKLVHVLTGIPTTQAPPTVIETSPSDTSTPVISTGGATSGAFSTTSGMGSSVQATSIMTTAEATIGKTSEATYGTTSTTQGLSTGKCLFKRANLLFFINFYIKVTGRNT